MGQDFGHTGRELELMLTGDKPLSMFYDDADQEPDERIIPEVQFDEYVVSGVFAKGVRIFDLAIHPKTRRPVRVRYVLYALKSEEWRIPAMFLVIETGRMIETPSKAIDWITSRLLGYSDEDIEKHFGYKRLG